MFWVLLLSIGVFVGAFGTLIGAAGGFILVPVLLFLYPGESPVTITGITLTVAFFNALSGSVAYIYLKRTDLRSVALFSITSIPGAILGAFLTTLLNRMSFQTIFGIILTLTAIYLIVLPTQRLSIIFGSQEIREIRDRQNHFFSYSFSRPVGLAIAFVVGIVSGMLGIGGGIMHVPALTQLLSFPAHIATATSHAIVAISTLSALFTHIVSGEFTAGVNRALVLSAGAVVGAQFGARLSQRITGTMIIRLLGAGLALVGLRLLIAPF